MGLQMDPNTYPKYFRFMMLATWAFQATVVFIILLIEIRTLYIEIYAEHITQMRNTSTEVASDSKLSPPAPSRSVSHEHSPSRSNMHTSTSNNRSSTSSQQSKSKLIFILPMLSYIFYILTAIFGAIAVSGIKGCQIGTNGGALSYCTAKMFMYIVYIYRIDVVYCASAFAYNKKMLFMLFAFCVIYTIGQFIVFAFTGKTQIYHYQNNTYDRLCVLAVPKPNVVSIVILDLFISILCTYLFVRPLLKLGKMISENRENDANELYALGLKYVILTSTAVTTTFIIFAVVGILNFTLLASIDVIINCVCILFFNAYYHRYYKIICCGSIMVCNKVWNGCSQHENK